MFAKKKKNEYSFKNTRLLTDGCNNSLCTDVPPPSGKIPGLCNNNSSWQVS